VWVVALVTRAFPCGYSHRVRCEPTRRFCRSTHYSAHAIHICAPNNLPRLPASALARGNSPEHGETTREMENSMRCGRARSSKETERLQVVRRTLGTTAKINSWTRVTLGNWRGVLCKRDFLFEYQHSLLLPDNGPLTRFKAKKMVCGITAWCASGH